MSVMNKALNLLLSRLADLQDDEFGEDEHEERRRDALHQLEVVARHLREGETPEVEHEGCRDGRAVYLISRW